jgi:hypothetical protein
MRSTSNQSSDGGSYSDLIHGDQGNTYTTTTSTATTTTTKVDIRKTVKLMVMMMMMLWTSD